MQNLEAKYKQIGIFPENYEENASRKALTFNNLFSGLFTYELKIANGNSFTLKPFSFFFTFHSNKQKMKEILNLHLVNERVNSEKIRSSNNNQVNWIL